MIRTLCALVGLFVLALAVPQATLAASHREAPITALDHTADITDWYAFVSPEHPDRVVLIMNVDPFLEPSNGPNYFPFDPGIRYAMLVDNDQDGLAEVVFEFRFTTQIGLPGVFTGFVGGIFNVPPITSLNGAGSEGFSLRQTYTVTLINKGVRYDLTNGQNLYAVPTDVGPRTMPDYDALRQQGIYTLNLPGSGTMRVFAGTVADPFFIDLGAAFDSLNFRASAGSGVLPVNEDMDDQDNYAPNALAGFNVNSIAVEVPITLLTVDGKMHKYTDKEAVIGTWATTSRPRVTIRGVAGSPDENDPNYWAQIQRMGNPLINELIIGTGSKDKFSMDQPYDDSQFANFVLNPVLAQIFKSIGIPVPPPPRYDLLPLVQYIPPICPGCGKNDTGPIADLLRLNTGIPPTQPANQKRLGFLAGDLAGYPDGRRPVDDVVDISARVVGGILKDPKVYNTRIGDGVNKATRPALDVFPFVADAYNGRDSRHHGPGQKGCDKLPDGICPVD